MANNLKLGNKITIGDNFPPFIVAEMSGNHNQSLDRAMQIVEAAAKSGAHALKLQTYTADTITLNVKEGEFFIKDKKSLWKGNSLYDLYKVAYTPWEWHKPLMEKCKELNMLCFSSPFDETAVDFLESLNVPAYKIASFEITHLPLIKKVAQTGKPVIVSTGMASKAEITETVKTLQDFGCKQYALLKCTSSYPADPKNSNIMTIPDLKKQFKCVIGLSDHTMGVGAALGAISHGANIIEKHFTLDRKDGGVDSAFSLQPEEMKTLVQESINAWKSIGKIFYGATESEKGSLKFRRSLYVSKDIEKNEVFTKENLRVVRPSHGLEPKHYEKVLGKKATKKLLKGTALKWEFLE